LTGPSLAVYFGTTRGGLATKMIGLFERHQPLNWECDDSYLRYWLEESQFFQSGTEEKWLQVLKETIDKLLH
jgi:hypothetical protein